MAGGVSSTIVYISTASRISVLTSRVSVEGIGDSTLCLTALRWSLLTGHSVATVALFSPRGAAAGCLPAPKFLTRSPAMAAASVPALCGSGESSFVFRDEQEWRTLADSCLSSDESVVSSTRAEGNGELRAGDEGKTMGREAAREGSEAENKAAYED